MYIGHHWKISKGASLQGRFSFFHLYGA